MTNEINRLGWITCPFCGTSFRVGVPPNAETLAAQRPSGSLWATHEFETACPRCNKTIYVRYR